MSRLICITLLPNFCPVDQKHSCREGSRISGNGVQLNKGGFAFFIATVLLKHVFSIRVENSEDSGQMASSEAS